MQKNLKKRLLFIVCECEREKNRETERQRGRDKDRKRCKKKQKEDFRRMDREKRNDKKLDIVFVWTDKKSLN